MSYYIIQQPLRRWGWSKAAQRSSAQTSSGGEIAVNAEDSTGEIEAVLPDVKFLTVQRHYINLSIVAILWPVPGMFTSSLRSSSTFPFYLSSSVPNFYIRAINLAQMAAPCLSLIR